MSRSFNCVLRTAPTVTESEVREFFKQDSDLHPASRTPQEASASPQFSRCGIRYHWYVLHPIETDGSLRVMSRHLLRSHHALVANYCVLGRSIMRTVRTGRGSSASRCHRLQRSDAAPAVRRVRVGVAAGQHAFLVRGRSASFGCDATTLSGDA